jgi:RNA polymerase sigma-70 factor (ECF subfamily)
MDETLAIDELVARAKAGDADAWAALYDRFAGPIYRFLFARVHHPADVEDLLQRVFLKVIEALPLYEERGLPFGAWLFRIARNTSIDFARLRRSADPLEIAFEHPDEGPGPAAIAEHAEMRARIRAALTTLTDEQRDVIVYRFFAGLTPSEIGALMGKREGSIRALQFRALEALRRSGLDAMGELPEVPR